MVSVGEEEVVEEYRIDGFTRVRIVKRPGSLYGPYQYLVIWPELDDVEKEVVSFVRKWFVEKYPKAVMDMSKLTVVIDGAVDKFGPKILKKRKKVKPSPEVLERIKYVARRDIVGFGKLEPLLKDPNIEDVHVLGIGKPVYVWHRLYENLPTNIFFLDPEDLERHLQKMMLTTGKFVSLSHPIIDGKLPMGYRINVVHSVVSELGTAITIRKHREIPFNIVDLIKLGTITPELAGLLWVVLENKRSVFIVGETAAGKTTLLNAVATLIPLTMKLSVIEEVREINLPHPNVVYMISREGVDTLGNVTLFDLVKTSLRQRPDYIVVGEIRGEEAYVLLQAISLGHGGLSTMHAEGAEAAVRRLMAPPMNIPPYMISLIDVIVHITKMRFKEGVKRYVMTATEVKEIDPNTKEPELNVIYKAAVSDLGGVYVERFRPEDSISLRKITEVRGISFSTLVEKVRRRASFLKELSGRNPSYDEVILEISKYGD